ncbi:MAG: ABC transporter permease subunit [Myxococcota bacterium]
MNPLPETPTVRALRALWLLTASMIQRLLREGMVLRSLVWPGLVASVTLTITVAFLALTRPSRNVAVPHDVPDDLAAALEERQFVLDRVDVDAVRDSVKRGATPLGTDGQTLWARGSSIASLEVEYLVRDRLGATWMPEPDPLPDAAYAGRAGRNIVRVLGMLFVMYGAVFGLGGVARDRDNGSLEAELALPIPRWISGFARWIASTFTLGLFFTMSLLYITAIVGVTNTPALIRHGIAACGASVALGIGVVGTAGLKQGFAGPFAVVVVLLTGLTTLGALGLDWLPLASLFSRGSGWPALFVSTAMGLLSAFVYAWRVGRG